MSKGGFVSKIDRKRIRSMKEFKFFVAFFILLLVLNVSSAGVLPNGNATCFSSGRSSVEMVDINDGTDRVNFLGKSVSVIASPSEEKRLFIPFKEIDKFEMKHMRKSSLMLGPDVLILSNPNTDQNPAIVSDRGTNLLSMCEFEMKPLEYNIGLKHWEQNSWNSEYYYFDAGEHPTQPRLDFYDGKTAYGTWRSSDPHEAVCAIFSDITNPYYGDYGGWTYLKIRPRDVYFTSADVGCYSTSNPPNSEFWGIIGLTSTTTVSEYVIIFNTEGGASMFDRNPYDSVSNISVDVDQSNGQLYIASDFVDKSYPGEKTSVIFKDKKTLNEDFWAGDWVGREMLGSHPSVDAKDGRAYVVIMTEVAGSKDIGFATTDTPDDPDSWKEYFVTRTPNSDEMNPVVIAHSKTSAIVVYTMNNNLYYKTTTDSGKTWSAAERINDEIGTVVEQYGCADIAGNYVVWTDNRNDNKDTYCDILDFDSPMTPSKPSGPLSGNTGTEYAYTTSTTDLQGDQIYYWFDWDDGTNSGWLGPYISGDACNAFKTWSVQGSYSVKVKAKDTGGHESAWSDPLSISMPKPRPFTNFSFFRFRCFEELFTRFPWLEI